MIVVPNCGSASWIACWKLVCLLILICVPPRLALAQRSDSFEGGDPRWLLVESDCQAQLTEHEISLLTPHAGQTCEMFEVNCTHGTMVLLAYPIEPCAVLDEFQPRIWTRCSSGRVQLGVRVVFPYAEHPVTRGRLSTILWGSYYKTPGQWEMLEVTKLTEQLQNETIALHQRYGADLKLDGAYIDCLVTNAYTGPGTYRVQIDDLDLRGMIPMASIGNPPPPTWRRDWRWRYAQPSGEQRFWAAPNRPSTWLQYQGETLAWVASLGFTGVVNPQLPSEKWLTESRLAGLGVIAPPPPYAVDFPPDLLPTFKGWLVGEALDSRQAEVARGQARLVSKLPAEMKRPMVAEALENHFLFSRVADELVIPVPLNISSTSARDKQEWLAHKLSMTRQRGEGWVSIHVGVPPTLQQQVDAAQTIVSPLRDPISLAAPLELRHQSVSAVLAGAKGVVFRTFDDLDISDPGDNANAAALRWINADLKLWGPWIVGGQMIEAPSVSLPHWNCAAWNVSQSHLIIAQTARTGSQHCLPPTREETLRFEHSLSSVGQQVFRLTSGTMERVSAEASAAGMQWSIEEPAPIEVFLISSNSMVLEYVRRVLAESAVQNAADQLEIATYQLGMASQVIASRFPRGATAPAALANNVDLRRQTAARRIIDRGWQALRNDAPVEASRMTLEAFDTTQAILFDAYLAATSNLSVPQSSPFVVTPGAFGLHWQVADACDRSQWTEVPVPGSTFDDLPGMLGAGWSQQRRLEEKVDLRVELVPAKSDMSSGLRLAAYAKPEAQRIEGGYGGASLRVRSAGIPVEKGQLVRVSATAEVIRSTPHADGGLLFYDNQVGPSLGQLVRGRPGERIPVEMYRMAVEDGEFRLLAECRGESDVILRELRFDVIRPATNRRNYPTAPVDPFSLGPTIVPSP